MPAVCGPGRRERLVGPPQLREELEVQIDRYQRAREDIEFAREYGESWTSITRYTERRDAAEQRISEICSQLGIPLKDAIG